MRNWLENNYVILSGASGGIGRALCKILITKYGAKVVGIGRSEEKMRSLVKELGSAADRFSYRLFDVGEKQNWLDFKLCLEEQGISPVLLVNNAGAFPTFAKALDVREEVVESILRTNYLSAVYAISALSSVPAIVNICSAAALCTIVGTSAYSASKGALQGYTEALMMEEKGKKYIGIVYPGTTATELFRNDEHTKNSALDRIAMPAEKMAKKIARKIRKKKKRAVVGWDAKLMNITAKLAPVKGPSLICGVMKKSKSKVFSEVFDYGKKK